MFALQTQTTQESEEEQRTAPDPEHTRTCEEPELTRTQPKGSPEPKNTEPTPPSDTTCDPMLHKDIRLKLKIRYKRYSFCTLLVDVHRPRLGTRTNSGRGG